MKPRLLKLAKRAFELLLLRGLNRHRRKLFAVCLPLASTPAGHLLFTMLLETNRTAAVRSGMGHENGVMIPLDVSFFKLVLHTVEELHGKFDLEELDDEMV
ncbi:hypothetical protein HPP92_023066 [Vanilla planifolia]|uniref:Uncharacterized protein n=1 Tax=Vanilla planifolia TaxID=51239 RepID=A0A835PQT3_VANPL|nr:hypothetical protein HPP92_023066 [Vanilla planifolia]